LFGIGKRIGRPVRTRTIALAAVLVAGFFASATAAFADTRPAIASWNPNPISISASQTITFNGSGFGTGGPAGFTGNSAIFEFQDLTQGWNAGDSNISTAVTVQFGTWSDTQVTIHGFGGAFGQGSFVLKAGDQVSVALANPQTGLWGSAQAAVSSVRPAVTAWSPGAISTAQNQTITFNGSGFGTGGPAGFTGNSGIFEFQDLTQGWNAGDSNISTTVTVQFGTWADNRIVISGFGGAFGQGSFVLKAGDQLNVAFANPLSGLWGSGKASVAGGLPTMPTPAGASSFIGCSSSWYVDSNGAPDLWSAISSQHCVYSHPTSGWPLSGNVAVFLQFGSYGDGCVPNASGTGSMPYYFGCASQSWGASVLKTISADWHSAYPGKNLFLVAVTTNQGNGEYTGGQGWASLVNGVNSANRDAGIGNVVVFGGSDIEDWCNASPCTSDTSPQNAVDWQNGYLSVGQYPVVNNGFLDCGISSASRPGDSCGAPGWYVSTYAQLFGSRANSAEPNALYTTSMGPVLNVPQFYSTWMVDQWAGLKAALHAWGGSYAGTYGSPAIVGAMTEVNSGYENSVCDVWWPNSAWAYAQNTDGIPTAFVTDIGWESAYTANSCG
jgi:hypothetical protein